MFIEGFHCNLLDPVPQTQEIESGRYLLSWEGERIDRYDIRNFLDGKFSLEKNSKRKREEEEVIRNDERRRIDFIRYNDYIHSAVTYDGKNDKSVPDDEPFISVFTVPKGSSIPKTQNEHRIIAQTAAYIATHEDALAVIAKEQKNNQKFGFLDDTNELHEYFLILLKSEEKKNEERKLFDKSEYESVQQMTTEIPQKIKTIIDNYIKACHANGTKFAQDFARKEKNNPDYSFLFITDKYHPYFKKKVLEFTQSLKKESANKVGETETAMRERKSRFDDVPPSIHETETKMIIETEEMLKEKEERKKRLENLMEQLGKENELDPFSKKPKQGMTGEDKSTLAVDQDSSQQKSESAKANEQEGQQSSTENNNSNQEERLSIPMELRVKVIEMLNYLQTL